MSFDVSDIVNNFQTAANDEISCRGLEDEGRAISGVQITDDKNPKVKSAKCSQMKLVKDVYNIKKDTKFNKSCDCELVTAINNKIVCPSGKFLSTVHPELDKGVCCKPCTTDNSLKLSATNLCENRVLDVLGKRLDTQCPRGGLVKEAHIMPNGIKVQCCNPSLEGETYEKQKALEEECLKMNIFAVGQCTRESVDEIKNRCTSYGITDDCTFDKVHALEAKCLAVGLDTKSMIRANPNNMCSLDNISKIEQECQNLKIDQCTLSNIAKRKEELQIEMRNQMLGRITLIGSSISLVLIVVIFIMIFMYRIFFRKL